MFYPARQNADFGRNCLPISAVFVQNLGEKTQAWYPILHGLCPFYCFSDHTFMDSACFPSIFCSFASSLALFIKWYSAGPVLQGKRIWLGVILTAWPRKRLFLQRTSSSFANPCLQTRHYIWPVNLKVFPGEGEKTAKVYQVGMIEWWGIKMKRGGELQRSASRKQKRNNQADQLFKCWAFLFMPKWAFLISRHRVGCFWKPLIGWARSINFVEAFTALCIIHQHSALFLCLLLALNLLLSTFLRCRFWKKKRRAAAGRIHRESPIP